jgi:hypothetical protein
MDTTTVRSRLRRVSVDFVREILDRAGVPYARIPPTLENGMARVEITGWPGVRLALVRARVTQASDPLRRCRSSTCSSRPHHRPLARTPCRHRASTVPVATLANLRHRPRSEHRMARLRRERLPRHLLAHPLAIFGTSLAQRTAASLGRRSR